MNINDIRNFLENEYLLKQLKLDCEYPERQKYNKIIFKQILYKYNWLQNKNELLYLIKNKNNLENIHIFCPICGNKNKIINGKCGYFLHCSVKCSQNDYNIRSKTSNTRKKDIDQQGLNSYQRGAIKSKRTKFVRYNDENYNNSEQAQKTIHVRIGKGCDTEAISKSIFEKKGVHWNSQTQEWKDKFHSQIKQIKQKEYETKKRNGTLKSSEVEDMIYQFLLYKFEFEDIIPQYKDKQRYNYRCDFYIKSLDLFIEYNGYWTHGEEPFNYNNIEHLKLLKHWIEESTNINFKNEKKKQYKKAMYIWTIDDVNKFKTAKQNNLNYLAFYSLQQFLDWLCPLINEELKKRVGFIE